VAMLQRKNGATLAEILSMQDGISGMRALQGSGANLDVSQFRWVLFCGLESGSG